MTQQWKLVPVEPTPEMVKAAFDQFEIRAPGFATGNDARRAIYAAMLAAAPTPPASAQDDAKDEQAAFEEWLERTCPSGDVESVQRQWEASSDYADFHAPVAGDAQEKLHTFLDAAAGEGLILGDVDAQELYVAIFPDRYAASQQQEG